VSTVRVHLKRREGEGKRRGSRRSSKEEGTGIAAQLGGKKVDVPIEGTNWGGGKEGKEFPIMRRLIWSSWKKGSKIMQHGRAAALARPEWLKDNPAASGQLSTGG